MKTTTITLKMLLFFSFLVFLTGCKVIMVDQIPDQHVSPLSEHLGTQYADDVKLYFHGEDIPPVDAHIAWIRVTGERNMREDLLWDYLKHLALSNHANALIAVEVKTILKREYDNEGDCTEFSVLELSGIAAEISAINSYWSDTYSSEYEARISNYVETSKEKNALFIGVNMVVTGISTAVLLSLKD